MLLQLISGLLLALPLSGEIFGDLRMGDKYLGDTKLELKCGDEVVAGKTDSTGSFRLTAKASGKCSVTVTHEGQTASVDVVLFDKPARYRLVLESKDGKLTLRRV